MMQRQPFATALAEAVADRDPARLGATFTDTVRLRALLPGGPIVEHGRDAVLARYAAWFGSWDGVELVDAAGESVGDRQLVHYRLDVRRDDRHWICSQTSISKLVDGRVATLDLLCSGFREI